MGICSPIISEDKVTGTGQMQLMPAPKGISFINIAKSSLPSPGTLEQGRITPPNKENLVQIGACAKQNASSANKTLVEIPKKLSTMAPKGLHFLSFGKGSISSSRNSVSSLSSSRTCVNYGFPNNASSSLKKDDFSKSIDGAKQSVPKIDLMSNGIFEKNPPLTDGMKSSFPGQAFMDDATTNLQGSSYSHVDHSRGKSVQQAKTTSDNSQPSTSTSSMHLVSQFDFH